VLSLTAWQNFKNQQVYFGQDTGIVAIRKMVFLPYDNI